MGLFCQPAMDRECGGSRGLRFIRPSDDELDAYTTAAKHLFRLLGKRFRALGQYFRASTTSAPSIVAANRTADGGNVLFRPIGLRIFAELTATLIARGETL